MVMTDLYPYLVTYRHFLETIWIETHQEWGNDIPSPPSHHMCRYTSLFLHEILKKHHQYETIVISGRPAIKVNGSVNGVYGYRDVSGCWHDHTWLQMDKMIIDLTADQFHGDAIFMAENDGRYNPSTDQTIFKTDYDKLLKRVNNWIYQFETNQF